MTLYLSKRTIIVLIATLVLFVGASYLSAWTAPVGTPPNNNVAAPINIGGITQNKSGNISAWILAALTEMRSDRYCDINGQNCARAGTFIFPVCQQGEGLVADANGMWQCTAVVKPPPPPPPPPPPQTGGWYQANNQSCSTFCPSIGKASVTSPQGTMCAAGERVVDPAVVPNHLTYPYGTWGQFSGSVGGHYQIKVTYPGRCTGGGRNGNCTQQPSVTYHQCYNNGAKQDGDMTDITVGCYCK